MSNTTPTIVFMPSLTLIVLSERMGSDTNISFTLLPLYSKIDSTYIISSMIRVKSSIYQHWQHYTNE